MKPPLRERGIRRPDSPLRKYDPSLPLAFSMARLFGVKIEEIFLPDPP
jgi:DNA-binding XRE family transcriptional regulator